MAFLATRVIFPEEMYYPQVRPQAVENIRNARDALPLDITEYP
jgi:hypothetical protein